MTFDVCYFMQGGVQLEYVRERMCVVEFLRLNKQAERLSAKQKKLTQTK